MERAIHGFGESSRNYAYDFVQQIHPLVRYLQRVRRQWKIILEPTSCLEKKCPAVKEL